MKSTIQLFFVAVIIICTGCKKHDQYQIKYAKDIYIPYFFSSKCDRLFDRPDIAVSLDTFNFHTYMSPAHPLYAYCKDDVHIEQFFGSNESHRAPFYIGKVNTGANTGMELFTFNGFQNAYDRWVTGYFSLKQPGGFTIFKGYESTVDDPTTLRPFIHKNYLLLWEETNRTPDSVAASKPKTIDVQYCVLKIMNNSTITVLSKQDGEKMIKEEFSGDLPSSGSFSF